MNRNDLISKMISKIFPEFSNKITWAIVMSGLAIISSPLVEKILSAFLKKEFNLNITDSNDALIGLLIVTAGLTYNFFYFREKNRNVVVVDNEPCVTVDAYPIASGNLATAFNISVKNSGGSLAKNIRLLTDSGKLENMFSSETLKEEVLNCFPIKV